MGNKPSRNVLNGRMDMPKVTVSAQDCICAGYRFIVTLNTFTFGFQSVNGIKLDRDVESYSEGGVNDHVVYAGKPERQEETLEFERGLMLRAPSNVSSLARMAATRIENPLERRAALIGIASIDPQEALESGPAFGAIEIYSPSMKKIGYYTFTSYGMKSWELSGGLDATKSDIMIERISIYHHGLSRKPVKLAPSIITGLGQSVLEVGNKATELAFKVADGVTNISTMKPNIAGKALDFIDDVKSKADTTEETHENLQQTKNVAIIKQTRKVDDAKKVADNAQTETEKKEALKDLKRESAELERISKMSAKDVAKEVEQKNASIEEMKKKSIDERNSAITTAENTTATVQTTAKNIIDNVANGTASDKAIANAVAKEMIADALEKEADTKDTIAKVYEKEALEAEKICAEAIANETMAKEELKKALQLGNKNDINVANEKLGKATNDKKIKIEAKNDANKKADNAREEADVASDAASDARNEAVVANETMQNISES